MEEKIGKLNGDIKAIQQSYELAEWKDSNTKFFISDLISIVTRQQIVLAELVKNQHERSTGNYVINQR